MSEATFWRMEAERHTKGKCPDHRPVLDEAIGWYCPACGAEAPPDAGPPAPAEAADVR